MSSTLGNYILTALYGLKLAITSLCIGDFAINVIIFQQNLRRVGKISGLILSRLLTKVSDILRRVGDPL